MMADVLDLRADDDLLDIGRGSAGLLEQQAVHVPALAPVADLLSELLATAA